MEISSCSTKGSIVGMTMVMVNVVQDKFPTLKHWQMVVPIATAQFLCGLIYLTPVSILMQNHFTSWSYRQQINLQGGQHILNLIDFYGVSFVALVLAVPELITFGWIYGIERLCLDMKFMRNVETSSYYRLTWTIVAPLLMLTILIYHVVLFEPITYNGHEYPAEFVGKHF